MNEQQLEAAYPSVKWRKPLPIHTAAGSGLGCRICIAQVGLKGSNVHLLPQTLEEFAKHIDTKHPEE